MKVLAAILCEALTVLLPTSIVRADEPLQIASEGYYPPFNYFDDNGALAGFDIDIALALCTEMKVPCEFVPREWDALIPGLLAGNYDAIIASMSITEDRKKQVSFTDPYYSNALSFVGGATSGLRLEKKRLAGKTIGTQAATISADYLAAHWSDVVQVALYQTQEDAFRDLVKGAVDLVLGDLYVGYAWLQSQAGKDFRFIGDPIDIGDRIAIAVRQEDEALRHRLDAALAAILADGTYTEINLRYFPFDIY